MQQIMLQDYQYNELLEEKLFINKYDFDFKYLHEMNRYWKELAYDIICELCRTDNLNLLYYSYLDLQNMNAELLTFIKNNYKIIIEDYKLNVDFRDYIELNDYVSLKEWLKDDNHFINHNEYGIFLIRK